MKTLFRTRQSVEDPELTALRNSLSTAQQELLCAYSRFNEAVDPELVEASIYEISSVKARCNYLIRAIKDRTCAAAATREEPQWS